ncbi:GNAT family N-acetyltransferase [Haloferacaceae archaeon DSL9]
MSIRSARCSDAPTPLRKLLRLGFRTRVMNDSAVVELETEAEWREAHLVLSQLRPHHDEDALVDRVRDLQRTGYRLFGLFVDGDLVAVAGCGLGDNLYDGLHAYVYDLVVDEAHRSRGHGETLFRHVESWAEKRGCERVVLSSGLQRTDAHRFYEERVGMDRSSYLYKLHL